MYSVYGKFPGDFYQSEKCKWSDIRCCSGKHGAGDPARSQATAIPVGKRPFDGA